VGEIKLAIALLRGAGVEKIKGLSKFEEKNRKQKLGKKREKSIE